MCRSKKRQWDVRCLINNRSRSNSMQMFRHHSYVMWVNPIIIAMSGLCGMRAQMRLQIQIWFRMFTDTNTDALLTALSNPCLTAHLGCGYQSSVEPAVFALGRIITWVRRREKEGDCIHPKGLTCSLISLKWLKAQPVNLSCNSKLLLEKRGKTETCKLDKRENVLREKFSEKFSWACCL